MGNSRLATPCSNSPQKRNKHNISNYYIDSKNIEKKLLNYFISLVSFTPPENIGNLWFSDAFKGFIKRPVA